MDAAKLKEERIKCGLTQAQAAALVHVAARSWQRWEAGDRKISPATAELFKIKAGISPAKKE